MALQVNCDGILRSRLKDKDQLKRNGKDIGNNCILFSNVAVTDDTPCWKFERFHIVKVQSEFSV